MFVNDALSSLELILPGTPPEQLQQLIAGTSSTLLESLDVSTAGDVLNAAVLALRKV